MAVCVVDQQVPFTGFEVRFTYDPTFDRAPECAPTGTLQCGNPDDQSPALDDNPDANAGSSRFSTPYLGEGWDCAAGLAPKGNDPGTTEADVFISCAATGNAPDARLTGTNPAAVITFQAVEGGSVQVERTLRGGAGAGLRGPRRVPPSGGLPWDAGAELHWTALGVAAWTALALAGAAFVSERRR